jgi:hypothetical protein
MNLRIMMTMGFGKPMLFSSYQELMMGEHTSVVQMGSDSVLVARFFILPLSFAASNFRFLDRGLGAVGQASGSAIL